MNPVPGGGFTQSIGFFDVLTPVIIFVAVIGIFTFGVLVVRRLTAIDAKLAPRAAGGATSWQTQGAAARGDAAGQQVPNPMATASRQQQYPTQAGYTQPAYGSPFVAQPGAQQSSGQRFETLEPEDEQSSRSPKPATA